MLQLSWISKTLAATVTYCWLWCLKQMRNLLSWIASMISLFCSFKTNFFRINPTRTLLRSSAPSVRAGVGPRSTGDGGTVPDCNHWSLRPVSPRRRPNVWSSATSKAACRRGVYMYMYVHVCTCIYMYVHVCSFIVHSNAVCCLCMGLAVGLMTCLVVRSASYRYCAVTWQRNVHTPTPRHNNLCCHHR